LNGRGFDKREYGAIPVLLPGEERFQICGDDTVQPAVFGMSRSVAGSYRHTPEEVQASGHTKLPHRKEFPTTLVRKSGFSAITNVPFSRDFGDFSINVWILICL